MRGCLVLLIGIALGVALMLYLQPRIPTGEAVPARADLKVVVSDGYITREAQSRLAGISVPSITGLGITSLPPNALVVRAEVSVGPVGVPASVEMQPYAAGGSVRVRVLNSEIAGIPVPPQLVDVVVAAINSDTSHLLTANVSITGVRVLPQGVQILANYR